MRCFTTCICCGCAYGWVLTTLQLLSWPSLWKLPRIPGTSRRRGKPQFGVVIEAIDPSKWSLTSMSDTCKVFHSLHMLWMWIWLNPYNITAAVIGHAFGSYLEFWIPHEGQTTEYCSGWFQRAIHKNLHFKLKAYKLLYNLHMLWMCIWMNPCHNTTAM